MHCFGRVISVAIGQCVIDVADYRVGQLHGLSAAVSELCTKVGGHLALWLHRADAHNVLEFSQ